jgi:hypothetical protein
MTIGFGMSGIPYRRLGRTGEMVSLIGVGGYHLGRQTDEQEAIRIIRTANRVFGPGGALEAAYQNPQWLG